MHSSQNLEEAYNAMASREYRKANGQFFTPKWIANGLARWVTDTNPETILDPAFGLGILSESCREAGYSGRISGYEIDRDIVDFWRQRMGERFEVDLCCDDFLHSSAERFDAVVANPPYNRFQNRELPASLHKIIFENIGEVASGYTNQYALFLYLCISRLSRQGRAAFIVPSEFLATGYGIQVKRFLTRTARLRHMILFDSNERIFPDAATTACVLLFDVESQESISVWHLSTADNHLFSEICGGIADSSKCEDFVLADLNPSSNWQRLGTDSNDWTGFVDLSCYGKVSRGIATGANEFFLLSGSQVRAFGLEETNLVKCIASADSAKRLVFTEDTWHEIASLDQKAYLFDGLTQSNRKAAKYITNGEEQGYHLRYLTKSRKPWYKLEDREPAPILLAVFGRARFKAVLNESPALSLTAFHAFYPSQTGAQFTLCLWLYFQTQTAMKAAAKQNRSYGDGLRKLEPSDWGKLLVPNFRRFSSELLHHVLVLAREAVSATKRGADSEFEELVVRADSIFSMVGSNGSLCEEPMAVGEQIALI